MGGHKADKLLNFSLLLFAATCILSITLAEAALVLMLAAILWKAFTSPEGFRQPLAELHANPLAFPLAVYLLIYMFSSIFSVDPARSWSRLDTEVIKALSAVLVFSAVSRSGREKAALWFIAGASVSALIGLWQFGVGLLSVAVGEQVRAHGTMIAVTYAEVTALALVLNIAILPSLRGTGRKLAIAGFILLSAGFAASLSRGPALGILVSFAALFIFQKRARPLTLAALAVMLVTFAVSASLNKVSRDRMTSAAAYLDRSGSAVQLDTAAAGRVRMWRTGVEIFRDYPLTGTGPYALGKVFSRYNQRPVDGVINYTDVHNLYLQRAADTGLPGLLALLLLFWSVFAAAAAAFRRHGDAISLWGVAAFLGFAAMMATDSSFDLPRVSFCVYLLAALAGPAALPPQKKNGA